MTFSGSLILSLPSLLVVFAIQGDDFKPGLCNPPISRFDQAGSESFLRDPGEGSRKVVIVVAKYRGKPVAVIAPYGPGQHAEAVKLLNQESLDLVGRKLKNSIRVDFDSELNDFKIVEQSVPQLAGDPKLTLILLGEAEIISENGRGKIGTINETSGLARDMKKNPQFKNSVVDGVNELLKAGLMASNYKMLAFDPKSKSPQHLDETLNKLGSKNARHEFPNLLSRIAAKADLVRLSLNEAKGNAGEDWLLFWDSAKPHKDGSLSTVDAIIVQASVYNDNGIIPQPRWKRLVELLEAVKRREMLDIKTLEEFEKILIQVRQDCQAHYNTIEIIELP